ncbi:bifunctional protein GAL10 [Saccharata proteae CBS 121410]|uniref:Bifunctional protein GAL10 n=1 Tax=Saccharata proteae CBS 121410 TaxID=1314787 RepID=A0A9P4HT48_9PEZI|nr:bifunctional protein GAL10 [Saccharata proteae CBS 121410]
MASKPESNFSFLPLGAIIQEFSVAGKNLVQGFPSEELYKQKQPFFGETIGRVANRISGARIDSLNGKTYGLAANNGPNSLHGGAVCWGKREFKGPEPLQRNGREAVKFTLLSPDGEAGYPGTVELRVWYTAYYETVDGADQTVLDIEYEAELVGDEDVQETVISVTNHNYFNLCGTPDAPSIAGTEVTLATDKHLVVDGGSIPTGAIESYPGVLANTNFTLGEKEPAIDHCFIMDTRSDQIPIDTRPLELKKLAAFHHPDSRIHLEIHSTEPAFQFYTGNFINVPAVAGVPARGPRSGFCVEPSRYVNATNVDEWKSQVLLKRGAKYGSRIVYRGWAD